MLGAVGALFAYSKRETLRLASELNRARAEGAASFDKLDTCIASHRLSEHETQACHEARAREESEFKATLDRIAKTGGATEAAMSRQMQSLETTFMARLRTCEDEANAATRQRADERDRLASESRRRESELTADRDENKRLAEARAGDIERCRTDLEAQREKVAAAAAAAHVATPIGSAVAAGDAGTHSTVPPGGTSE